MKIPSATLVLLSCFSPLSGADKPRDEVKHASAILTLTRPGDGGVFGDVLDLLRRDRDEERPFEWEDIDKKIDQWFEKAKTRFPEDFSKHGDDWQAFREQSKRDARKALAPVELAWKESVDRAVADFEASEAAFYARKPSFLIRGSYNPPGEGAGNRDEPAWELEKVRPRDAGRIRGGDTHDTEKIVLKAAGIGHPMFALGFDWSFSLEAWIDPESLEARPIGAIHSPVIRAWLSPRFEGTSDRKVTRTVGYFDGSVTPIGPIKLTIGDMNTHLSIGFGIGFTYDALAPKTPKPELRAGVEAAVE